MADKDAADADAALYLEVDALAKRGRWRELHLVLAVVSGDDAEALYRALERVFLALDDDGYPLVDSLNKGLLGVLTNLRSRLDRSRQDEPQNR